MSAEVSEAVAAMILERQTRRTAEWRARREADIKFRTEHKRARNAGLKLRHAAKLAHNALSAGG